MSENKKRHLSAPFSMLLLILAAFLILAGSLFGAFVYDINKPHEETPFTVYLRRGDKRIRALKSSEAIIKDGEPLISVDVLSQYCSYGVAGDTKGKTIVFPDGSYAQFRNASSFELNSDHLFLSDECVITEETVYVPLSFYEDFISGLKISRTPTQTKLVVDIDVISGDFDLISNSTITDTPLSFGDYFDAIGAKSSPEFKLDLSEYEEYMNPADKDRFLFLVNYENFLDKDYKPSQLTDLIHTRKDGRTTQQLDLYAAKAMEAMLKEAAANGYTSLSITSGYRSYNYQQQLYNNQVAALRPIYGDKAKEKATEAVALPGTSEHQSGLCADLHNLPSASQAFANTKEYTWLSQNCAKFGFILRYPKNKTDITKIMFEPWHYRYVGRYHAQIIMQEGLCLEEYMKMIEQ
ncbi:MAG: D-alanyl-D-alanine carboxypeptidase family protein [Ruminococcaceae bacterium]|nr:D-alanyl-D-alanine carboxypeptidase family protein [Oscillospiraceae bacterium]